MMLVNAMCLGSFWSSIYLTASALLQNEYKNFDFEVELQITEQCEIDSKHQQTIFADSAEDFLSSFAE